MPGVRATISQVRNAVPRRKVLEGEGKKEVESKKIKNRTGRICELFLDLGGKWR